MGSCCSSNDDHTSRSVTLRSIYGKIRACDLSTATAHWPRLLLEQLCNLPSIAHEETGATFQLTGMYWVVVFHEQALLREYPEATLYRSMSRTHASRDVTALVDISHGAARVGSGEISDENPISPFFFERIFSSTPSASILHSPRNSRNTHPFPHENKKLDSSQQVHNSVVHGSSASLLSDRNEEQVDLIGETCGRVLPLILTGGQLPQVTRLVFYGEESVALENEKFIMSPKVPNVAPNPLVGRRAVTEEYDVLEVSPIPSPNRAEGDTTVDPMVNSSILSTFTAFQSPKKEKEKIRDSVEQREILHRSGVVQLTFTYPSSDVVAQEVLRVEMKEVREKKKEREDLLEIGVGNPWESIGRFIEGIGRQWCLDLQKGLVAKVGGPPGEA